MDDLNTRINEIDYNYTNLHQMNNNLNNSKSILNTDYDDLDCIHRYVIMNLDELQVKCLICDKSHKILSNNTSKIIINFNEELQDIFKLLNINYSRNKYFTQINNKKIYKIV